MISPYLQVAAPLILAALLLRFIIRRIRVHSIAQLPGPPPGSWLAGNLPALLRPENIGDAEFEWTKTFGTSMRIKGAFGSDMLFTADPKALQYILNTSGYNFPKLAQVTATAKLTAGKGIAWAHGSQHTRHRKIMNPAFSYSSLRAFLPLFQHTAQRTVAKWKDLVMQSGNTSSVIDIPPWLARTTLDALGKAAFDYQFGALDEGTNNELSNVYNNLFIDVFFKRSDYTIAFEALWGLIPKWLVDVIHRTPTKQLQRFRNYMRVARRVAKSIVDRQDLSRATGKEGGKDVMSILGSILTYLYEYGKITSKFTVETVRANLSEDPKSKLDEDEILSQLTTLMLAGHESTGSTTTWALYELARHPDFQDKVRDEIRATRAQAAQRGDGELSVADLDSMKCLLALMKETLRYYPILSVLNREAGRDDIIPLTTPQTTKTGETITSIPVSKGQCVVLSIAAYNRLKSVWGEDADVWRPERFFEGVESNQKTGLGVFANLATFSSGLRSCIGWRFALIEMQAILIELIESFEFSPPPGNVEIVRGASGIMSPMVKGSKTARAELPLTITPII